MQLSPKFFPNLHAGNHRDLVCGKDECYNCIAWAAGFNRIIWDPKPGDDPKVTYYWPPNAPADYKITSLIAAFASVGFAICVDGSLEAGIEKIAIYGDGPFYEHTSLQLETGKWTSKMGPEELIEHDGPENLEGPAYGNVTTFMKRTRTKSASNIP